MSPVLLAGLDTETLSSRLAREPLASVFRAYVERIQATAEEELRTPHIRSRGWCHSQYFTPAVLDAAFVWHLTGAPWALAHVRRQLDRMHRVYADYPASFYTEIDGLPRQSLGPYAYFSVAHTALAADLCRADLGADFDRYLVLLRETLLRDRTDAPYFFTHFNAGHNAVVTHVIAIGMAAMVLARHAGQDAAWLLPPAFKAHAPTATPCTAALLVEHARDACAMHLNCGFDERGVPYEGPMYALVTLDWVYLFADLLRRSGGEDLFATLRPRFEAVADALAGLQLPGCIGYSGFQDCRSLIQRHPMPWLLLSAAALHRPQDAALWAVAVRGDHRGQTPGDARLPTQLEAPHGLLDLLWWDGVPPATDALRLPAAFVGEGAAVAQFRSSSGPDAVCATLLGQGRSHNVPDHTHADAGHFSLFAYGDYLAYDTAYFNLDEDTHSVVLVDGKPDAPNTTGRMRHGRFMGHGSSPLLDWVSIDAAAAKGCIWAERTVLFIRGDGDFAYLAVLDNINRDNGVHQFQWQLQGNLHTRVELRAESAADLLGQNARLECHFFTPRPEDYPGCPQTLRVFADAHPHLHVWTRETETNPRLVAEQTAPNCNLLSLLLPRRAGEPRLSVRAEPGARTFNVYVEHGDWTDQIVFAPDHRFVRLPDLRADCEAAVVRRDRQGRIVAAWSLPRTCKLHAENRP